MLAGPSGACAIEYYIRSCEGQFGEILPQSRQASTPLEERIHMADGIVTGGVARRSGVGARTTGTTTFRFIGECPALLGGLWLLAVRCRSLYGPQAQNRRAETILEICDSDDFSKNASPRRTPESHSLSVECPGSFQLGECTTRSVPGRGINARHQLNRSIYFDTHKSPGRC
jgi:hypothetical protein